MSTGRKDTLYEALSRFYEDHDEHRETFMLYSGSESPLSLRLLDWFVTNYAKKHNIVLQIGNRTNNVFMDYKAQLKAYSKRYFDPFCRRERIDFQGVRQTTVGQMNFFRWAILSGVLDYVFEHREAVENDMLCVSKTRETSKGGTKRHELSTAAIKSCTKTYCHVTVRF
jgi:hypothetical protein